ncbi:hypothetical protein IE81DRAFT_252219 [Ceraceosorus guamensis]|uniref:Uncharacterized protein n=1 Tax=Ceraceosorus guamensis TaxID=1522189 RepID=A0A316W6G3_9BASI|nr:hypothetical protein IE81DRAFT_252219 [Ceraceosorus guamensis]PWN44688.1 hypothetical protein IE81DRAFT_252219 [Ceraceosorus guamensis]
MTSSPMQSSTSARGTDSRKSSDDSPPTYPNAYLLPAPSPPSRTKHLSMSLKAALEQAEKPMAPAPQRSDARASAPGRSLSLHRKDRLSPRDGAAIHTARQTPRAKLQKPLPMRTLMHSPLLSLTAQPKTCQTQSEKLAPTATVPITSMFSGGGVTAPRVQGGNSFSPRMEEEQDTISCHVGIKRPLEMDNDLLERQEEKKQVSSVARRAPSTFCRVATPTSTHSAPRLAFKASSQASRTPSRPSCSPSSVLQGSKSEPRAHRTSSTTSPLQERGQLRNLTYYPPHASSTLELTEADVAKRLDFTSCPTTNNRTEKRAARLDVDLDTQSSDRWRAIPTSTGKVLAEKPLCGSAGLAGLAEQALLRASNRIGSTPTQSAQFTKGRQEAVADSGKHVRSKSAIRMGR